MTGLARAAAGPLICAAVLIGLLSAWTASGGAGTLTRVRLQVTLAAVPMRAFTPQAATGPAHVYLVIRNLSSVPDELVAVRSPVGRRIVLVRRLNPAAPAVTVAGLVVPGNGTLSLSPLSDDVVLDNPSPFEARPDVPLTLVFRRAGQITIDVPVTAPGAP